MRAWSMILLGLINVYKQVKSRETAFDKCNGPLMTKGS